MKQKKSEGLGAFFAWMDQLNMEAVRREYCGWPLQGEVAHSRNCWIADFHKGLSPAQALDANGD
jgi:hypothetical protein